MYVDNIRDSSPDLTSEEEKYYQEYLSRRDSTCGIVRMPIRKLRDAIEKCPEIKDFLREEYTKLQKSSKGSRDLTLPDSPWLITEEDTRNNPKYHADEDS